MENENGSGKVHKNNGEACIHHWLIDEKNFGVCKKCGASKQFSCGSWYDSSLKKSLYNKSGKIQPDAPGTKP